MGRTCPPATRVGPRRSRHPSGRCDHPTSYPALTLTVVRPLVTNPIIISKVQCTPPEIKCRKLEPLHHSSQSGVHDIYDSPRLMGDKASLNRRWCDTCRGEADGSGDLHKCATCPRRFHLECESTLKRHDDPTSKWSCSYCSQETTEEMRASLNSAKAATTRVRALHKILRQNSLQFYEQEKERLAPFVPADRLRQMCEVVHGKGAAATSSSSPTVVRVGPTPSFLTAHLRPYQVEGVNWMLDMYDTGVGGVLADEMGLGKTVQTLAFLAALKDADMGGPHLIVTPLAVLQNWHNEIKKFAPTLRAIKIHGSMQERDRVLTMPEVLGGDFDVYLTSYEMIISEEAFFTETFLFHTITIDEGHRLKNDTSKLSASLARISAPFRLILTGTPLQNNLNELWALMHYVLPRALEGCSETFAEACCLEAGQLNREVVGQARALLESIMLRRIKADVEKGLLPKIHRTLKVPLSQIQREWYKRVLEKSLEAGGIVSHKQLINQVAQLQKLVNHPKCILIGLDRQREAARSLVRRAEGAEFFKLPAILQPQPAATLAREAELRALEGRALVEGGGKLQLLDRLMTRLLAQGSRALLFSQYTLTLDVLCEYCAARFGPEGTGFLRLDGATNRIKREMDVRAFNKQGSSIPIFLISTRAGGQGINLASADVVILYDTSWNPQVDLQAEDRAHRIGQTKQVTVYRFIADSTMEERVLARARQKLVLDAMVIQKEGTSFLGAGKARKGGGDEDVSDEGVMSKLSLDELWSLLFMGAEKVLDPTNQKLHALTDDDMDTIIDHGRLPTDTVAEEEELPIDLASAPASASSSGPAPARARLVDRDEERKLTGRKNKYAFKKAPAQWLADKGGAESEQAKTSWGQLSLTEQHELIQVEGDAARSAQPRPSVKARGVDCEERKALLQRFGPLLPPAVQEDESRADEAAPSLIDSEPKGELAEEKGEEEEEDAGGRRRRAAEHAEPESEEEQLEGRRRRKATKLFAPTAMKAAQAKKKKVKIMHESLCFSCHDGGELMECSHCPKVYHATLECAAVAEVPGGRWQCPWHACFDCDRSSSQAGGVLFHCLSCPTTYCFDCCPDRYSMEQTKSQQHAVAAAKLERSGISSKAWLFFSCDECLADKEERLARGEEEEPEEEMPEEEEEEEEELTLAQIMERRSLEEEEEKESESEESEEESEAEEEATWQRDYGKGSSKRQAEAEADKDELQDSDSEEEQVVAVKHPKKRRRAIADSDDED